jgi:hypothetical protein
VGPRAGCGEQEILPLPGIELSSPYPASIPTELSALSLINQISAVVHVTKPEYGDGKTARANGDD